MATYTIGPFPCTGTSTPTGLHEFYGKVVVTETVNVASNTSDIVWEFQAYVNRYEYVTSFYSSGMNYVTVKMGNSLQDSKIIQPWNSKDIGAISLGNGQQGGGKYVTNPLILASGSTSIVHENDGTKSLYIEAYFSIPKSSASYLGSITVAGTINLTNIPRASAVTSVTDVTIGSAPVVKWTPAVSTYTFRISFSCGSWSYEHPSLISPGSTSEQTFNSYSIPSAVAAQITRSNTGTGTCKIETFSDANGNSLLGSTTKSFTITVPSTYGPTADIIISSVDAFHNYCLSDITSFNYDCSSSSAQSGASIVSYVITVTNGAGAIVHTGTSATGSVAPVSASGTLTFSLTVTDSRGYTDTIDVAQDITKYSKPSIVSAFITRGTGTVQDGASATCQDFSVDEGSGNVARITYSTSYTFLTANTLFVSISYIKNGSSYTTTGLMGGTNRVAYFKPAGGGFDPDEAYSFTISVYDTISTSSHPETMTLSLSAAKFPIDVLPDGSGIAFGKVADETNGSGVVDSAWHIHTDGHVRSVGTSSLAEFSNSGIVFTGANNTVTGKITNVCYGVMVATCSDSDIDSNGLLYVSRDVFNANIKMVLAIIPTSDISPVCFSVYDSNVSSYTVLVKKIDGGVISSGTSFYVLALPA